MADECPSLRILLIEDEAAVARLTELVLNGAGYTVDVVADHAAAPGLLAAHAYDLVIADTVMGPHTAGLDGLEGLVASANCPVLLFSAHRFSASDVSAAGFAGMIVKPYDIDELLEAVNDCLSDERHCSANGQEAATA